MRYVWEKEDVIAGKRVAYKSGNPETKSIIGYSTHAAGGYYLVNTNNGLVHHFWSADDTFGTARPFTREELAKYLTDRDMLPIPGHG